MDCVMKERDSAMARERAWVGGREEAVGKVTFKLKHPG